MKRRKEIENFAEDSMKNLVNEEFYRELSAMQAKNTESEVISVTPVKKPFYKRISKYIAFASTSIVTLVVLLCVFLIQPQQTDKKPIYGFDHQTSELTSATFVNSMLDGIQIEYSGITSSSVVKDKQSGDTLYYQLVWAEEKDECIRYANVSVITNPYFEYLRLTTDKEIRYQGLTVFYFLEEEEDSDGLVIMNYYAYFETDRYRIGIQYEEYTYEEPLGLTDFLDGFFIFG